MSHFEMLRPLPVVAESDCQQGQSASSPASLENSQGEGLAALAALAALVALPPAASSQHLRRDQEKAQSPRVSSAS